MDINDYRSNPGRCAALESILDSPVFREAVEAIATTNKTTEAMVIAANIDSPNDKIEARLLNQQLGREAVLRDLRVCSVPLSPPKPQQEADYGAPEAMAALSGPDAPDNPWQPAS